MTAELDEFARYATQRLAVGVRRVTAKDGILLSVLFHNNRLPGIRFCTEMIKLLTMGIFLRQFSESITLSF
jgi:hypothetical protein